MWEARAANADSFLLIVAALEPAALAELAEEIPPAWYEDDYDALLRLLEQIHGRRARVGELLVSAKKSNRQPFPHWRSEA